MNSGKYIVLEGPEGVGKSSQLLELARRLQAAGLAVRTLREPDSQSDLTARAIRHLTQDPRYPMNTNTEVLLYNAARSQSLQVVKNSVESGVICLVDRNYLTTLAVQYYGRGDIPDYEIINQIINFAVNGCEPDLTIVLDAPVPILRERLSNRHQGDRFDKLDSAFLERVRAGYLWEANNRQLPVIFANDDFETVANKIWKLVAKKLSEKSSATRLASIAPPVVAPTLIPSNLPTVVEDLIKKTEQGYEITIAGKKLLEKSVTNTEGNVYAFRDYFNPATIAAAMARLSRRSDDMRITLLDEFANNHGKEEALLKKVITAYGDDSVQQLAGIHLVVENASNLLTKKLEWSRLAAYLEQSTRYIYYDKKDANNQYRYYIPKTFDSKTEKFYRNTMDEIFSNYSKIVHQLTDYVESTSKMPLKERDGAFKAAIRAQACDAARPLLPVATTSTVGIFASAQAVEAMIMRLASDEMDEARKTAAALLEETRKIIPIFFERADKPERGGAISAYRANTYQEMKKLAETHLGNNISPTESSGATLTDVWPRNELDLVADMLYEHSDLSLKEIRKLISEWSYDRKVAVFKTYMGERLNRRHKPGRALEKAHYSWDIICDYGIFRDLQRHRIVEDLAWQKLSPRYGYEIPKLVEDCGLSELFENCFSLSLKLYSFLQTAGYTNEAQYAVLLGHRMRWKITYNAREAFHLHELRTAPQGHPGYRKLVKIMHDKVAEVHPLIAQSMNFVNKGEDEALTRLAAERYNQFKLNELDGANKRPLKPKTVAKNK